MAEPIETQRPDIKHLKACLAEQFSQIGPIVDLDVRVIVVHARIGKQSVRRQNHQQSPRAQYPAPFPQQAVCICDMLDHMLSSDGAHRGVLEGEFASIRTQDSNRRMAPAGFQKAFQKIVDSYRVQRFKSREESSYAATDVRYWGRSGSESAVYPVRFHLELATCSPLDEVAILEGRGIVI
jgi:hypothetical protein